MITRLAVFGACFAALFPGGTALGSPSRIPPPPPPSGPTFSADYTPATDFFNFRMVEDLHGYNFKLGKGNLRLLPPELV